MGESKSDSLFVADMLLIGVAAVFWPAWILAANTYRIVHPERLVALALIVWFVAASLAWLMVRLGASRPWVVHSMTVVVALIMSAGSLMGEIGELWAFLLVAGAAAGAVELFRRLGSSTVARAAVVGLGVALASGPLIIAYETWAGPGSNEVLDVAADDVKLESRPDIFLVFLDAYPGSVAMEQDSDSANEELIKELIDRGFQVPPSAWSSYWATQYAIPAVLEMGYPVVAGGNDTASVHRVFEIIAGDNALVEILDSNGYETYLIESSWSGSRCSQIVDNCVPGPIMDEAMFLTLRGTVLRPLIINRAGPFTDGAVEAMEWLLSNGSSLSASPQPSFVFAHFVAPHPPFFLDEECRLSVSGERSGATFYLDGVEKSNRERFFVEQITCLHLFMNEFADLVTPNDVVIFVSDHGTDRRDQVTRPAEHWGHQELVERMNVFLAVRTGVPDCDVGDTLVTTNLMRRVLDCHTKARIDDVPPRMWMTSMVEVERELVQELLTHGVSE